MMVTRQQFKDARSPECGWTEEKMLAAIDARFPGDRPVDLGALINSWLADSKLSRRTLTQCALLATRVSGVHVAGPFRQPRAKLELIAAALDTPTEEITNV